MAKDHPTYTDDHNESLILDTADNIALAISDLGARMGAVETALRERGNGGSGGTEPGRLERLEAVLAGYFRDEFATYDAERAAADAGRDTATGGQGSDQIRS